MDNRELKLEILENQKKDIQEKISRLQKQIENINLKQLRIKEDISRRNTVKDTAAAVRSRGFTDSNN